MILTAPFENHEANKSLRCNWLIILHKTRIHMCIIHAASECHAKIVPPNSNVWDSLGVCRQNHAVVFLFLVLSGIDSSIIRFHLNQSFNHPGKFSKNSSIIISKNKPYRSISNRPREKNWGRSFMLDFFVHKLTIKIVLIYRAIFTFLGISVSFFSLFFPCIGNSTIEHTRSISGS